MKVIPRRVEKPWGYELIWAETDKYLGKILHVNAGEALSLQYHERKDETLFLLSGELKISLGSLGGSLEEFSLVEGESVRIEPGVVHLVVAVTDVDILEASTPEIHDVVRLDDRYGRS